jgi:hypothetical protein
MVTFTAGSIPDIDPAPPHLEPVSSDEEYDSISDMDHTTTQIE